MQVASVTAKERCLTGYMTDVQSWVTEFGKLSSKTGADSVDLSGSSDAVLQLQNILVLWQRNSSDFGVRQLSLAKCGLRFVPEIFHLRDSERRPLADTLRYLSLYSNNFQDSIEASELYSVSFNATNASSGPPSGFQTPDQDFSEPWAFALKNSKFKNLRELDLRSCMIQTIENRTFQNMPSLEALYLGENLILHIEAEAFYGLDNLLHLDLSNNGIYTSLGSAVILRIDSDKIFAPLINLGSLDLSNTKLTQSNVDILQHLSTNLQSLSICNVGITALASNAFNRTNIKYLDVSGNSQILAVGHVKFLELLSSKLVVLYAIHVGLQSLDVFKNFINLEILQISNNVVSIFPVHVAASLKSLKILDMSLNRLPSWFGPIYSHMSELVYLSLIRNNLNMISEAMIYDLSDIKYIGLSDNYFVCSCQVREFLDMAMNGDLHRNTLNTSLCSNGCLTKKQGKDYRRQHAALDFHTGYTDFEYVISSRVSVQIACHDDEECNNIPETNTSILLFDFNKIAYTCYTVNEDSKMAFPDVPRCVDANRNMPYDAVIEKQMANLAIMISVPLFVLGAIAAVLFKRWWCVRYFCITVKNSAMLSIIGNEEKISGTEPVYHYDVFVSYCNEDRAWVLDQLLPQVEADCNVSVCLHERDFQVGLSILENIVSCMDRSRDIMLVISNKFLQSQWCQFEMHLAQHRLLETRREDLILILLEDVPRRKRPPTLHYLMMTKTYIVWPETSAGRDHFWRRVKRSLNQKTNVLKENVSFA